MTVGEVKPRLEETVGSVGIVQIGTHLAVVAVDADVEVQTVVAGQVRADAYPSRQVAVAAIAKNRVTKVKIELLPVKKEEE